MVVNVRERLEVGLNGFDAAGIEVWLGAVNGGVVVARGRKAGKRIEKVKGDITLALANHTGGAALEDADLGDRTRLLALRARNGMEHKRFVAGEQPFPLAAGLPDEPQRFGILVKAEGEFLDGGSCLDKEAFEQPATEILDEVGLEKHSYGSVTTENTSTQALQSVPASPAANRVKINQSPNDHR